MIELGDECAPHTHSVLMHFLMHTMGLQHRNAEQSAVYTYNEGDLSALHRAYCDGEQPTRVRQSSA